MSGACAQDAAPAVHGVSRWGIRQKLWLIYSLYTIEPCMNAALKLKMQSGIYNLNSHNLVHWSCCMYICYHWHHPCHLTSHGVRKPMRCLPRSNLMLLDLFMEWHCRFASCGAKRHLNHTLDLAYSKKLTVLLSRDLVIAALNRASQGRLMWPHYYVFDHCMCRFDTLGAKRHIWWSTWHSRVSNLQRW